MSETRDSLAAVISNPDPVLDTITVRAHMVREILDDLTALEAKLEECLIAKSLLYPPGATYLNNPDNMNDPRMLNEKGEVITP